MLDFRSCWLASSAPSNGVSPGDIREWQHRYGLTLPVTLVGLLGARNGGQIERLGVIYEVLPLHQIRPLTDDTIRSLLLSQPAEMLAALNDAEVPVPWLVFPVLIRNSEAVYLLCYPEHSSKAEPVVFVWVHGHLQRSPKLVEDLFGDLTQQSDFPAVDLKEAAWAEIVADESLTVPAHVPNPAWCEIRQVLGRRDGQWLLFIREVLRQGDTVLGERRTRAMMPEALNMQSSHVTVSRLPRAGFTGTWSLPLRPRDASQVVFTHSQLTRNGKWQNEESHGEPASFTLESTSERRLLALHRALTAKDEALQPQAPLQELILPNEDAITESLRMITDGAIRAPRRRLATH